MLQVTGAGLAIAFLVILAVVIGIILMIRLRLGSASKQDLASKYGDNRKVMFARQYPEVNAFGLSRTFFLTGLAGATLLTLLAFSWTTYDREIVIPDNALELPDDLEIEPPRTAEPPPPPPPPPPPVIEEVPEEEVEEEIEFEDQTVEEETVIEEPPPPPPKKEAAPPPPPPPPPPPEPEPEVDDEIFTIVQDMPRFPGCEEAGGTSAEKKACSDKKMLEYVYGKIKYPTIARENGIEGLAVISFVIEKDGTVTDPKIVRDVGGGCGKEALRIVQSMPQWVPGRQRNQPVRVQFNLPVKFRLEG